MRFTVSSVDRPKAIARALQAALGDLVGSCGYNSCLGLVARFYGYRTWRELHADIGREAPSAYDHEIDEGEKRARIAHQIGVLVEYGVAAEMAEEIIAHIGPTSRNSMAAASDPASPLERNTGSVMAVKASLEAAGWWLNRNGRSVRLHHSITPEDDSPLLTWNGVDENGQVDQGYYLGASSRGLIAGLFEGLAPARQITIGDLPKRRLSDDSDLSTCLSRMGYLANLDTAQSMTRNSGLTGLLGKISPAALCMLRAKSRYNVDDYNALKAVGAQDGKLYSLLADAPALTSLIAFEPGIPAWPVGLGAHLATADKQGKDPAAEISAAISDDTCTAPMIAAAIKRCSRWIPNRDLQGITETGLRLLSLCPRNRVPTRQDEIDALVGLGHVVHARSADAAELQAIVADAELYSWVGVMARHGRGDPLTAVLSPVQGSPPRADHVPLTSIAR